MADFDKIFLSTLSLRRATYRWPGTTQWAYYFYPRSPCGERRYTAAAGHHSRAISIHALLAESDSFDTLSGTLRSSFLSTLSLRRATQGADPCRQKRGISIHALLAESDLDKSQMVLQYSRFLSTLSLRRATGQPSSV